MDAVLTVSIVAVICALLGIGVLVALFYFSDGIALAAHRTTIKVAEPPPRPRKGVPGLAINAPREPPMVVVTVQPEQPTDPKSSLSSPRSIPPDWFQKDSQRGGGDSPTFSEILRQSIASHPSRRSDAK